jgi:predicted anti-sigma-YlaC factor YlaD
MKLVDFKGKACGKYRQYFDAYLDSELLIETNQDVVEHLASCPNCARVMNARAELKRRLKSAITGEPLPCELLENLRACLRSRRRSEFWA